MPQHLTSKSRKCVSFQQVEVSAWIHHERNIFINKSSLKCYPELVLILLVINESKTKMFRYPHILLFFFSFLFMYRPLQIQYSQIAKAALRFIIPWSSLNKGPKFILAIKALLSLNWDAGHLFWESCETLTCKPLSWNNPMSRTPDSSWSQQSVQWHPLPSKHLYLHLPLYHLLTEPRGLASVKNAVGL